MSSVKSSKEEHKLNDIESKDAMKQLPYTITAHSRLSQTDIVIGTQELKGTTLAILHSGNTPEHKKLLLDSMSA